jgi:hypothetical protein
VIGAPHPKVDSHGPIDSTAAARVRAAELFAFAARDERGLSCGAQLCCWAAVATLAVTSTDIESGIEVERHPWMEPNPIPAHEAIRQGLSALGQLELDLFADPRVREAAKLARRALMSTGEN